MGNLNDIPSLDDLFGDPPSLRVTSGKPYPSKIVSPSRRLVLYYPHADLERWRRQLDIPVFHTERVVRRNAVDHDPVGHVHDTFSEPGFLIVFCSIPLFRRLKKVGIDIRALSTEWEIVDQKDELIIGGMCHSFRNGDDTDGYDMPSPHVPLKDERDFSAMHDMHGKLRGDRRFMSLVC